MKPICKTRGHYWISVAKRDDGLIAQQCMNCTKGRVIDPRRPAGHGYRLNPQVTEEAPCPPSEASPETSAAALESA